MGVGIPQSGDSILVVNEQTNYADWEFLYDPRIETLKAKSTLLGGGPTSTSATSLGTASGLNSGVGGTSTTPGTGTTPTTGTGGTTPP
jgi:hypothetical protein